MEPPTNQNVEKAEQDPDRMEDILSRNVRGAWVAKSGIALCILYYPYLAGTEWFWRILSRIALGTAALVAAVVAPIAGLLGCHSLYRSGAVFYTCDWQVEVTAKCIGYEPLAVVVAIAIGCPQKWLKRVSQLGVAAVVVLGMNFLRLSACAFVGPISARWESVVYRVGALTCIAMWTVLCFVWVRRISREARERA